ncbi:MAG TPA: ROK family protein [Nitrospirae bacterium]|nr:glucokinase [bacterium BMS3Abin10]GBE38343.1 glucokinase [bacterium BMS3Bbin08]HDK17190.1 ROK family protein [Nitrospirota bacterium]HDK81360.1 ROK family protein [Nitrospirota bacterium]
MKSAIGIDIGGTNIKAVLVSGSGDILKRVMEPTPTERGGSQEKIRNALMKILRAIVNDRVIGIGFGIAGVIDREKGLVLESPNIPEINGFRVKDTFEKEFSLPVVVDNDANTYAYGEKWIGVGKDIDNFALLTLGTGLGGGIIYKGEVFDGPAEIGHMVIEPRGRVCTCGSYGCLESYASGRAVMDMAISALEKGAKSMLTECCDGNFYKITPELVYKTALEGDNLSRDIFRETGQYLGIGIGNLINIFNLDAVVFGGGLIGAWDLFIEDVKKEFLKRSFKSLSSGIKILKSVLKEDGGSIGAAGLVLKISGQGLSDKGSSQPSA